MAEQGPIALPTDSSTGNWWSDLQHWFDTKLNGEGERTPLLGDDAAAARKRRRYNIKIAVTSLLILIATIVVIVFAVDWFKSGDEGNRGEDALWTSFVTNLPSLKNFLVQQLHSSSKEAPT